MDLRPRTHPEAMLEDNWRFFDLSPEARDREQSLAIRSAMSFWWTMTEQERERAEWAKRWGGHYDFLDRWAREWHEQHAAKGA